MPLYCSVLTQGFYDTDFAKYKLPHDAKEISRNEYEILKEAVSLSKEIIVGESGILSLKDRETSTDDLILIERGWIEAELGRIRDELEKVQDSDPKAVGTVSDWRSYRKALRSWVDHKDFPNKELRPVAPDV